MLIQKTALKPFTAELPVVCYEIIKEMLADSSAPELFCHRLEMLSELCGQTGKVEFAQYHEVLNMCDSILQHAVERSPERDNMMNIDCTDSLDDIVITILKFTSVLFENTFFRSVYASFSELIKLLDTTKPKILTHVLRLLVSISKTSRYIMQHVSSADQKVLSTKLMAMYDCWDKCEWHAMKTLIKSEEAAQSAKIRLKISPDVRRIFDSDELTLAQANTLLYNHLNALSDENSELDKITPLVQLRFNFYMNSLETRIDFAIHCLMSMSVVFYSRCLLDEWRITNVVKDITVEEICDLVQLEASSFSENVALSVDTLRTESLKTLASIVFLEKNDKLQFVVDNLGLNSYLGYAANVMRRVVHTLKTGEATSESTAFITSLFSLIYHIAGFENGGLSLVNISTIPTLLDVVSLQTLPDSLISFATRAVRIIDILTSLSFNEFNTHDGIQTVVRRLVFEIGKCREFIEQNPQPNNRRFVCHHHRSALIKSLLNFLKRTVVDSIYINHSRRIMEGELPAALMHIFKLPAFYGSSLIHCALELTTVFIYQEPAQLNLIHDSKLSDTIIELFSNKRFPISREIVLSLPNICSALCLNERGLVIFNEHKPLNQIFRIIFSSGFIQVLRKRKNELVSAGGQLGIHFDEFMRHQQTLRRELIVALVTILDEIIAKAKDNDINVSSKPSHSSKSTDTSNADSKSKAEQETSDQPKSSTVSLPTFTQFFNNWSGFSNEQFQELKANHEKGRRTHLVAEAAAEKQANFDLVQEGNYMPLSDYMVLAIKMIEAILSNSTFQENSTIMIESKLIEKLLEFFTTERIMPIVGNPNYLHSLPSVFRLLLQQSRTVQAFTVISKIVKDQLVAFELPENTAELTSQKKVSELNRLASLVTVFFNFLRMSFTNSAQESRSVIFQYLANDAEGLKFISEISSSLQKFGKSIAHFNKEFRESVLSISRKNTTSQPAPQISVEITTNTSSSTENVPATPAQPKEESTSPSTNPPISAPYSLMSSIYKNLIEIICQFGKTANSTRTRRIPEGQNLADTNKIAEELLNGIRMVFENVDYSDNWTFYIQNSLPIIRRLICDDSSIPYPLMLSYFIETRCHNVFFESGEKLLNEESLVSISAPLLYWFSTLLCLLNVENMTSRTQSNHRLAARDSFVVDDYLSHVQEDSVHVVGKIFDRLLDTHMSIQVKKEGETTPNFDSFQLLEKVLEIFKEIYHGIFVLHNKRKSSTSVGATSVPAIELDSAKISILMDMGFTHAQAVNALTLYSSVDEAAEHLLTNGNVGQDAVDAVMAEQQPVEQSGEAGESSTNQEEGATDAAPSSSDTTNKKEIKMKSIDFQKSIAYLTDHLIPKCLNLMEKEPSIVFSVAELLRVFIYDSEIKEWSETMLIKNVFVRELNTTLTELCKDFEKVDEVQVKQFASQIHLICLLWNGFDDVYINSLKEFDFYNNVIQLVSQIINTGKHSTTLLAPLILWLDLYKKEYFLVRRRTLFNEAVEGSIQWHYWMSDDQHYGSSGIVRREFSPQQSLEINAAFKAGKSECKLKSGDKKYTIDFITMTQKQSDRSSTTPIYGSVKLNKDFDIEKFVKAEQELHNNDEDSLKLVDLIMQMLKSSASNNEHQPELIFSLVSLLHRLTSEEKAAQRFIELDGIETLVFLRCNKPTQLLTTVVCLILRNCCLNENLVAFSVNRLFNALNAGQPISSSDQHNKTLPSKYQRSIKEWRRLMRLLTGSFCDQHLRTFTEATRELVTHKDFGEFQLKHAEAEAPKVDEKHLVNLKKIFTVITNDLFQHIDNKTTATERVLQPSNLLLLIAELIRSYPQASDTILTLQHDGRSFLELLLGTIILDAKQTTEMIVAANAVFFSECINASNLTECNESMVEIIKKALNCVVHTIASKEEELSKEEAKEYCQKITTLTKFTNLLKDCNPPTSYSSRDPTKKSFVYIVHDKHLLLEFVKAIRLIPLSHPSAAETSNSLFRFVEEFSRAIGVAKADIAARELAANDTQQPTANSNQPADENAEAGNEQQVQVNAELVQQHAEGEQVNPADNANQGPELDIFDGLVVGHDDEEETEHDHLHYNDDFHQNIEDDYEEDEPELMYNENAARSNSSSSSSESGDGDVDRTDQMEQAGDEQQNALNEAVANADAENAIVRNLEQMDNGHEVELTFRRRQDAIRNIMEESEEEPNDGGHESDDDDIELIEDSTDDEEMELDTEDTAEEDEMQNPAQNEANFSVRDTYDLDIEMLPNESVVGRGGGGLLQIRNGGTGGIHDANFIINPGPGGIGNDLATSISLLTEYISGFYNGRRANPNILLNPFAHGDNNEMARVRTSNAGQPSNRAENLHPLLRRPSRQVQASALSGNNRPSDNESVNFVFGDGNAGHSPFGADPHSHALIENAISAIGSFNQRSRSHRTHRHVGHHHGLRRQNALRSRPYFTNTRGDFNHPRLVFNGPTRIFASNQFDGQFNNLAHFSDEQELMNALQDPYYNSFARRTVDSFIPFMLDRATASTRLLNSNSVHYIGMIIAAYLGDVCRQKPASPTPPVRPLENVTLPQAQEQQEIGRPNEDEARSVDAISVDSSELTNRFANMDQGEDEEATRDTLNEGDGDRTPQQQPIEEEEEPQRMEVEQSTEQPAVVEQSIETEHPARIEPSAGIEHPIEPSTETEQPIGQSTETERPTEGVAEDEPGPSGLQEEEADPDGIDPAFLAALPEDIRNEVILDHQRQQRLNQLQHRQRQISTSVGEPANQEAQPNAEGEAPAVGNQPPAEEDILDQEFLAALPPELQEEVLAQHEQRLAQQAARNAVANPNAGAAIDAPGADAIAFLDSLNPSLRAQVLADADDTIIQILPENLAAEANRIRRDYEHEQLMRFADIREHRNYAWRGNEAGFPENYNMTANQASIVQILDRESIATIALFYFFNNEKFTFSRFHRVFKVVVMHSGTCDFVLRSLLSILSAACADGTPIEGGELGHWSDSFKIQPSSANSERILYIGENNKIIVNKHFRSQVCTRVFDTLSMLARQTAIHFFNSSLRYHSAKEKPTVSKPDGLDQFWKVVEMFNTNHKNVDQLTKSKELEPIVELSDEDIRNCPFGLLLELSSSPAIANSPQFLEKVLRILHSVLHVPASITHSKQEIPLCSSDEINAFLLDQLKKLIVAVMSTQSADDSFRDFRNFLVQLLYAYPSLRYSVFTILYDIVRGQGQKLSGLLKELRQAFENQEAADGDVKMADETGSKPGTSKDEAPKEDHLEKDLPPLRVLSSKRNSPKQMLRSLNVISHVRNQLSELYKRRRPQTETTNKYFTAEDAEREETLLHSVLDDLVDLWDILSYCLDKISHSKDNRAVMGLQNAAETFFLLHSLAISKPTENQQASGTQAAIQPAEQDASSSSQPTESQQTTPTTEAKKIEDQKSSRFTEKILDFAGKHRVVLNQILRGNTSTMENMLTVLSMFPKLLDFDIKRKFFYREIKKIEGRSRMHHDDVVVRLRRSHLFSDAYRELFRLRPADWRSRFYIIFEGEEGQDAGGLLREFFSVITREIFNPNYALFITTPGDGVTYMINKASFVNSEHLLYFKFAGHIIAKAIYDQKQLDCYFARFFYRQILDLQVNYTDIESFDVEYYKNLMFLLENPIEAAGVELNFNVEVEEFGVRSWRELKENGNNMAVTDENKEEYVRLVCREKLTVAVQKQLDAFLEGFYEIIPRRLISVFNEQELELLISGLPEIDIDDLAANTEYKQYTKTSPQIQWFWRALRSFEKENLVKFLQFVFGSSKVPLNGFSELQGMNGVQKFTIQKDSRGLERLPAAHTCFNTLDLPIYESYEKLESMLLTAIRECASFGFA